MAQSKKSIIILLARSILAHIRVFTVLRQEEIPEKGGFKKSLNSKNTKLLKNHFYHTLGQVVILYLKRFFMGLVNVKIKAGYTGCLVEKPG